MLKYGKRLLVAAGVVATASTITVSGLTAASASQAASHTAASHRTASTEHFRLMSTAATSSPSTIIATGKFTAGGTDIAGRTSDLVKFPGGTFRISHSRGHGKQTVDRRTCLLNVREHGRYKLSHGTGAYAGISGHGRYVLRLTAVAARNAKGNCSQAKLPVAAQETIRAHGPVKLK
jgi:hypothetical protein